MRRGRAPAVMTSYHAVHVVTLSFDDGFASSSLRTAEIFERHGLVAELNIVATGRYNLHGLDGEGWGPVGGDTLDRLLERLAERGVRVLPITAALAAA